MTDYAKKEAEELIEEFDELLRGFLDISWDKESRACALICVNKMLAIERKYSNFGAYEHLQEVKKEIEQL